MSKMGRPVTFHRRRAVDCGPNQGLSDSKGATCGGGPGADLRIDNLQDSPVRGGYMGKRALAGFPAFGGIDTPGGRP
jgi:hypothetical protein